MIALQGDNTTALAYVKNLGDTIPPVLPGGKSNLALCGGKKDSFGASFHCRLPQRGGRCSVEEVTGGAVGMGSEPVGLQETLDSVGLTISGLVRHEQEQQTASLLLSLTRNVSSRDRRVPTVLVGVGGVRISSNKSTQTSNPEAEVLARVRDDPHHSLVGMSAMVP